MTYPETASDRMADPARRNRSLMEAVGGHKDIAICLILAALLYAGLFQPSIPHDNQNTYLLSGLASSGYGHLSEDWLSNATTPFVVFSWIVGGLNEIGFLGGTYVLSFALVAVFALAGLILFRACLSRSGSSASGASAAPGAIALFVLLLSLIAIYDNFMLRGVAGQYALGMYLQPSEFAVLMILSVALFAADRPLSPYVCAALAGVFHQSYLLSGAMLVVGVASYELFFGKRIRRAAVGSVVALAIVSPILWYSYVHFAPMNAETFEVSRQILARYRLPHHAIPIYWFSIGLLLKLGVMLAATVLSYFVNRRLTFVMGAALAMALLASGAALLLDSNSVYLLFPWRISVVLMPLAAIILVTSVVRIVFDTPLAAGLASPKASVAMALLAVGLSAFSLSTRMAESRVLAIGEPTDGRVSQEREAEYRDLIRFVRGNADRGQLYLHNPIRFQSLRIRSGMPVFVDFKSHPYREDQVVEWWDRLNWARELFSGRRSCTPELLDELHRRGITHVIFDKAHDGAAMPGMVSCIDGGVAAATDYDNGRYSVIRIAR